MNFPRMVFVGAHMEAEAPFRYLIGSGENVLGLVTLPSEQLDRMSGAADLASVAKEAAIPVLPARNINDDATLQWIAGFQPDVLLVIGWTQLLKEPVLRLASVATFGFHASLLPKYRGRAPINWALIHGESETGNTLMVLEPGADEGDIVAQRRIPIGPDDTCATLYRKVGETEVDMLAEVLPLMRTGRLPRVKQDSSQATVMPKRRPEDGLIDWSRTAAQLYDWVRALTHPYPGAFTFAGDTRIIIWEARVSSYSTACKPEPGTVAIDSEGWPIVAAGEGWLRLIDVQADGKESASTLLKPGAVLVSRLRATA